MDPTLARWTLLGLLIISLVPATVAGAPAGDAGLVAAPGCGLAAGLEAVPGPGAGLAAAPGALPAPGAEAVPGGEAALALAAEGSPSAQLAAIPGSGPSLELIGACAVDGAPATGPPVATDGSAGASVVLRPVLGPCIAPLVGPAYASVPTGPPRWDPQGHLVVPMTEYVVYACRANCTVAGQTVACARTDVRPVRAWAWRVPGTIQLVAEPQA